MDEMTYLTAIITIIVIATIIMLWSTVYEIIRKDGKGIIVIAVTVLITAFAVTGLTAYDIVI